MDERAGRVLLDIERLRARLAAVVDRNGLDRPMVHRLSHRIDALVNEYYRLIREGGTSGTTGNLPSKGKAS